MDEENVEGGRPVERPLCQAGQGGAMAQTRVVTVQTWESGRLKVLFLGKKKVYLLFLAVLGLCCCVWAFSSCGKGEPLSSCGTRASLVAEHLAATVPADVNRPVSQQVLVSKWEPACSFIEDASLGLRLPLSGSGCPRLPPCLWWEMGQCTAS